MLDLDRVQSFLRFAEVGNVTAAAQELHLSQPALSRQLQTLQHDLGVDLVRRAGRNLELTAAGRRLVPRFRALVDLAEAVRVEAVAAESEADRDLTLVAPTQSIEGFLARAVQMYLARYRGAAVKIIEASSSQVQDLLEQGAGHLAIAALPIGPQFHSEVLATGTVHVAVEPDHDVAGRPWADIADLHDEPVQVMLEGTLTRSIFDSACELNHIRPRIVHESSSPHALAALAAAGQGPAVMPFTAGAQRPDLEYVPLRSTGRPLTTELAAVWSPNLNPTEPMSHLIADAKRAMSLAPFLEVA